MSLPQTYYHDPLVTIYLGDNREILPALGAFDLLCTDPPYGIGVDREMARKSGQIKGKAQVPCRTYTATGWDDDIEPSELMDDLRKRTNHQIIFGGNYYPLPPCRGWLVWDKENDTTDFADAEMAWTSLDMPVRLKRHMWNGMLRKDKEQRWHPTQKPIDVMLWALRLGIDKGGFDLTTATVLDPFGGSGTTGRAAKDLGLQCVLIEREEQYAEIAAQRMQQDTLSLL